MNYATVCSGVEAPTLAWEPLGWKPAWFSEIEPFPCAVLKHRWPDVPNLGDMTKITDKDISEHGPIDVFCGGPPCQDFSDAGPRAGMDGERGNLSIVYARILSIARPRWFVFENVPGLLTSGGGRDFKRLIELFTGFGYCCAWRILDSINFGLPQPRKRLFVVGFAGDWRPPAAVLFDIPGSGGDRTPPGSKEYCETNNHGSNPPSSSGGVWWDGGGVSQTLDAVLYKRQALPEKSRFPAVLAPAWVRCECCEDFICQIHGEHAHDCSCPPIEDWIPSSPYDPCILRWITAEEAESLMGMPRGHTRIPWRNKPAEECPEGPRVKAIGNSMAVPCLRWIGERIQAVDDIHTKGPT